MKIKVLRLKKEIREEIKAEALNIILFIQFIVMMFMLYLVIY